MTAGRVDAALVPVIAYQMIDDIMLVRDVCVGARRRVRSVCLVTRGQDLADVRSVALDRSSRTSVTLTKIIFREFLGFEPAWHDADPDIDRMLADSDAALLIGDPALALGSAIGSRGYQIYDLAELWHHYTGFGFVFAMWMTRSDTVDIDFAGARDEGLDHLEEIIANYSPGIGLEKNEMRNYLSDNISFSIDEPMRLGMQLFFELAEKNDLIPAVKPLRFI